MLTARPHLRGQLAGPTPTPKGARQVSRASLGRDGVRKKLVQPPEVGRDHERHAGDEASTSTAELAFWPAERPFQDVALDRTLALFSDVFVHAKRAFIPERDVPGQAATTKSKPVVLVLGTGWAAHALSKVVDHERAEVVIVAPRNFFIFTPMLPSSAVGSVEFRSLLEPIREANPHVQYYEAVCDHIDVKEKVAYCTSSCGGDKRTFQIRYDSAVLAHGEVPGTFNTPGVSEHCFFMKEVQDARAVRRAIGEAFELASMPGTDEEERRRLLHFVVVGGGPTGVEYTGTLKDFLKQDLSRKYRSLMSYVQVSLVQGQKSVLTQFSAGLQERALETLTKEGINVLLNERVVEVTEREVALKSGKRLPYGVCVWSGGNAARQLTRDLVASIPEQGRWQHSNPDLAKLAVDPYMRVIGAEGVFAIGDCSRLVGRPVPATAQAAAQQGAYVARLINEGWNVGEGSLAGPAPWRPNAAEAGARYTPLLADGASPLEWIERVLLRDMGLPLVNSNALTEVGLASLARRWGTEESLRALESVMGEEDADDFVNSGRVNDTVLVGRSSALPVCRGTEVHGTCAGPVRCPCCSHDALWVRHRSAKDVPVEFLQRPFEHLSLGVLAYLGGGSALTQIGPTDTVSLKASGSIGYLLWRSVYITKQVSTRNRVLILFDWLKSRVFGRDISML